jgi:hypothetical protein
MTDVRPNLIDKDTSKIQVLKAASIGLYQNIYGLVAWR